MRTCHPNASEAEIHAMHKAGRAAAYRMTGTRILTERQVKAACDEANIPVEYLPNICKLLEHFGHTVVEQGTVDIEAESAAVAASMDVERLDRLADQSQEEEAAKESFEAKLRVRVPPTPQSKVSK